MKHEVHDTWIQGIHFLYNSYHIFFTLHYYEHVLIVQGLKF